jgi:hypothetical protein
MEVIMKNKYEYPPGLFGLGFIAAGSTAKPPCVQPKNAQLASDEASQIRTEAPSEPISNKRFRPKCKRKGSSSRTIEGE